MTPDALTLAKAALIMREAMRDEGWQKLPLGEDVAAYLRHKRKMLTPSSYATYRLSLAVLSEHFADLAGVEALEAPVGTELLEEFLDRRYAHLSARTYNKHLRIAKSFVDFWRARERLHTDPFFPIEAAKPRGVERQTFSADQCRAIIAENPDLRDKVALRLMLHYALRKGSLKAVRFQHFDHQRKRLTYWAKGGKVCQVPIRDPAFWHDLERLIVESEAQASHYLLHAQQGNQHRTRPVPEREMASASMHEWWYRCMAHAGIVPEGVERGERMHKSRHTAGQHLYDATGDIMLVKELLQHESIQTTADIYTICSEDQLAVGLDLARQKESFGADD